MRDQQVEPIRQEAGLFKKPEKVKELYFLGWGGSQFLLKAIKIIRLHVISGVAFGY
ncbi:hypothetical protein [Bartonella sp. B39]